MDPPSPTLWTPPTLVPERRHYCSFYISQMPQGESWRSEFMSSPERVRREGRERGKDPVSSGSKLRPAVLKASPHWESSGFVCLFRVQRIITGRWDSTTQKNKTATEKIFSVLREKKTYALCRSQVCLFPSLKEKVGISPKDSPFNFIPWFPHYLHLNRLCVLCFNSYWWVFLFLVFKSWSTFTSHYFISLMVG